MGRCRVIKIGKCISAEGPAWVKDTKTRETVARSEKSKQLRPDLNNMRLSVGHVGPDKQVRPNKNND